MPEQNSFDYALIRIVPRVECEEFINAGLVFLCLQHNFLAAHVHVSPARLTALWPDADAPTITQQLESFSAICKGEESAGPIAQLTRRERFHWLTAPRSTIIQTSPVHTGLCDAPEQMFHYLVHRWLPR